MEVLKKIELESFHRFAISNLLVDFALMGKSHIFPYDEATVTITLPGAENIPEYRDPNVLSMANHGSYRMDGDKKIILTVYINFIQVSVNLKRSIYLPQDVLKANPVPQARIPEADKPRLEEIGELADTIASKAFEYWVTIMRWRCNKYRIGRPPLPGPTVIWQNSLIDAESKHHVWSIGGKVNIFGGGEGITTAGWADAQASLQSHEEVPVNILLLDDARECFIRSEYRRSVIDLTVACEVFIRSTVMNTLPENLDTDIRDMIDDAHINQYRKKFFPNLLTEEGKLLLEKLYRLK
jgi:hypothetical protein